MTFPELLQHLRQKAGMTQADLATAAGLSLGIIRDYEQGRKEPAMRSAFKLAEVLGVSCEKFKETLSGTAEPQAKTTKKNTRKKKG